MKYNGITNHRRAKRNLKETPGIELVRLVKNNHRRLMSIATETGCSQISFSNFWPVNVFRMKIKKIIAKIGSAGIEMSTVVSPAISLNNTESGVKQTVIKRSSLMLKKAYQAMSKKKGIINA